MTSTSKIVLPPCRFLGFVYEITNLLEKDVTPGRADGVSMFSQTTPISPPLHVLTTLDVLRIHPFGSYGVFPESLGPRSSNVSTHQVAFSNQKAGPHLNGNILTRYFGFNVLICTTESSFKGIHDGLTETWTL